MSPSFSAYSSSDNFSAKYASTSSNSLSIFASLSSFWTACTSTYILSLKFASTSANTSSFTANDLYSNFSFPISAFIFEINSHIFFISTCAAFIASSITSSGISSAPASIIAILSIVPATVKRNLLTALWASVGFITICPSTYPTFTEPVGPPNGISDMLSAADEPIIAHTSGEWSWSTDNTNAETHTSFLKSFGNSGLIGLSITLDVRIAFSLGFPSLFWKLPGIFPTASSLSS